MKSYPRAERVGGQIQRVLSEILVRRIRDPRLDGVTITGVEVSRDLRFARVYFVTGAAPVSREAALEGFREAGGFVKRTLARELGLRYMPEIRFSYDESLDRSARIDELLRDLKSDDE